MSLKGEALRLMGMKGRAPDEAVSLALDRAISLGAELPFRSLTRPCALSIEGEMLLLDGCPAPGLALKRHLAGCSEGVLIGATLGAQADSLLRRALLQGLVEGAAMQAALSARLEKELDELCLALEGARPGFYLTPRFSPGYADLPLSFQPFFMERLQMSRLGVHLTSGFMMAPAKSVTAVAGWRRGAHCHGPHKCAYCPSTNCPYRSFEENKP